jgi:hypothetical protein
MTPPVFTLRRISELPVDFIQLLICPRPISAQNARMDSVSTRFHGMWERNWKEITSDKVARRGLQEAKSRTEA